MNIAVNILGIVVAAFIVWWFWISKRGSEARTDGDAISILVDGGVYTPSVIHVPAGKPVTLRFLRKDTSPCAEKVIFSGLDISADLPVGRPYDLSFTPGKAGEYDFTCQMAMYRGRLIVEEKTKS
ncbi:MAG: cupredoxin domain-containing protein [Candidatus Dadabacteria bacterium]|nr:cupredoxin domain-containing protein [Candidatus Dadabacteria bacterium]